MTNRDGCQERERERERECQENLYCWHALMMRMMLMLMEVIYLASEHIFLSTNKNNKKIIIKQVIGLVWFYGISTIVGYLMPNPLHT